MRVSAGRRAKRGALASRLVRFTLPLVIIAVGSTSVVATPVLSLPGRTAAVQERLRDALAVRQLAQFSVDQGKHYVEYLYLPQDLRHEVDAEIVRTRLAGDGLLSQVPTELRGPWRQLHDSGEALLEQVADGSAGRSRAALLRVVSASNRLRATVQLQAEAAEQAAEQALDELTGVAAQMPPIGGRLGAPLADIAAESGAALTAARAKYAMTRFVAAYPALLAQADAHATDKAAAAAADVQDELDDLRRRMSSNQEHSALLQELLGVLEALRSDGRRVAALAAAGDREAATAHFEEVLHARLDEDFLPALDKIQVAHWDALSAAAGAATDSANALRTVLLSSSVAFMLVVLTAGVRLLRGVATPLRELERAHRRLADGDTGARIPPGAAGSLGDLATSFNVLAQELATGSSARLAKAVLDNSDDVLLIVEDGNVTWASAAAERLSGGVSGVVERSLGDLVAGDAADLLRGQDPVVPDAARLRRANGTVGDFELTCLDLRADAQVRGWLVLAHDVTERKAHQAELAYRASHDPLTGLPNRSHVVGLLERLASERQAATVLFCDLDNFKDVNDSLGHAAGDVLLVEVGRRLVALGAIDDVGGEVGRLGGDEFIVVLAGCGAEDGRRVAEAIGDAVRQPFALGATRRSTSCTIGVAVGAAGSDWQPHTVLQQADLAMYRAKHDGRGRVEVFAPELQQELLDRLRLDDALADGLDTRVQVHYQPIVEGVDGRIVGVEALLRWWDGDRMLSPEFVVQRAEATAAIHALGRAVLGQAVRQVAAWRRTVAPDLLLSVNVSVTELERPGYAADVVGVLTEASLPTAALTVEVTESTLSGDGTALVENLRALRTAGVSLSVDDFGTGWSSMSRLRLVTPDEIKIDRSFVAALEPGGDDAIVRTVLALAHELGCRVVAEGVERAEQQSVLLGLGCQHLQGYFFGRPVDAATTVERLAAQKDPTRLPRQRSGASSAGASTSQPVQASGVG